MKGLIRKSTLSLYRHFKPGDRVKRYYQGETGKTQLYEGIIMTVDYDQLEIYWDKIDGIYPTEWAPSSKINAVEKARKCS